MKIGFIGTGNMGSALINGLAKMHDYRIFAYDTDPAKIACLSNVTCCSSVTDIAKRCEVLIMTVKPIVYDVVIDELTACNYNNILVSVAAGITSSYISNKLKNATIIRTMPNTPALVGAGVTLISDHTDTEALQKVVHLFSCVGNVYVLAESLLEAGTALSGSSPAIIYHMIDVMANHALSYGIPKNQAISIVAQTVLGSAKMVLESSKHPAELIDNVCSPGGTTIAAMNTLAKKGFDKSVLSSMDACVKKTYELKK